MINKQKYLLIDRLFLRELLHAWQIYYNPPDQIPRRNKLHELLAEVNGVPVILLCTFEDFLGLH